MLRLTSRFPSRLLLSTLAVSVLALSGACGTAPASTSTGTGSGTGTTTGSDGGQTTTAPLSITSADVQVSSAWGARVTVVPSRPARQTWTLQSPSNTSVSLPEGITARALGGLRPQTSYTLVVRAEAGDESVEQTLTFQTPAPRTFKVLFDAGHAQQAGSADWVIDDALEGPPKPVNPGDPDDWKGALSGWAFALAQTGRYTVESTKSTLTADKLSGYDVLVLVEPNTWGGLGRNDATARGTQETQAIRAFLQAGHGVIAVGDHAGSDRDNDGIDSVGVLNHLLGQWSVPILLNRGSNEYGETEVFSVNHPLLPAPFGPIRKVALYAGATVRVDAPATWVATRKGASPTAASSGLFAYSGAAEVSGGGRVFVHGDSSGTDDDDSRGGWNSLDHAAYFMAATAWAAGEY